MVLSQTEVNVFRLLALGFCVKEIATILDLELKDFVVLYSELKTKTKCWDDIELGLWWAKNQVQYLSVLPDNLLCFDFTNI
jgi:DNA-binding NarL/FixJ family response regulator